MHNKEVRSRSSKSNTAKNSDEVEALHRVSSSIKMHNKEFRSRSSKSNTAKNSDEAEPCSRRTDRSVP
ncbi:hypothetical protein P8452_05444 [Trifolium repens]|nr:hypothetical protein QL285_006021 [Trifolium repens]WJX15283.1 hypothetical protein P8452_05444 [Trifolium repens]